MPEIPIDVIEEPVPPAGGGNLIGGGWVCSMKCRKCKHKGICRVPAEQRQLCKAEAKEDGRIMGREWAEIERMQGKGRGSSYRFKPRGEGEPFPHGA